MCVHVHENIAVKSHITCLHWAEGVLSISIFPRGAAVLQPVESKGLRQRNLRDNSVHF